MPITLELRENDYVMYIQVTDPWDVPQMTELYPKQKEYLDKSPHKLHTFVDMSLVQHPPKSVLSARINAPSISHPNSGLLILISKNSFLRMLADAGFRISRFPRAHTFDNVEDGWAFLRQQMSLENPPKSE